MSSVGLEFNDAKSYLIVFFRSFISFSWPDNRYIFNSWRSICKDIEHKHASELEERDKDLARKVAEATLAQLKAKFEADLEHLKEVLPSKEKEERERLLDLKYIKERQMMLDIFWQLLGCFFFPQPHLEGKHVTSQLRKGQAHTKAWMDEHCKFVTVEGDTILVKDIAQHKTRLEEKGDGTGAVSLNRHFQPMFACFGAVQPSSTVLVVLSFV